MTKHAWMIALGSIGIASAVVLMRAHQHADAATTLGSPDAAEGEVDVQGAAPWPFRVTDDGLVLAQPAPGPGLLKPAPESKAPRGERYALAYQYDTRIFERPKRDPQPSGIVRRGTTLMATRRVHGKGCEGGAWYELASGGYACSRDGFLISAAPRPPLSEQPSPDVDAALPFRYAKMAEGAPRFLKRPSAQELEQTSSALSTRDPAPARAPNLPRVVSDVMDGIYFVALPHDPRADIDDGFYRTVRGRAVHKDDASFKPAPQMHGELLGETWTLPLAFVWGEDEAPVLGRRGTPRGSALKHARFPVTGREVRQGVDVVVGPGGLGVPASRVRIADAIARPAHIPERARWVHVNLSNQTLVAYQGSTPVFATLVSSGLEEGFATPTGTYQVREKHITTTMSGPDPDKGYYEIEEIPWVQYYLDSYALHGAYWHDEFGKTRSHGCTNLAPIDARFLFYFTSPELPHGWHARRRAKGSYVHFTRSEAS